MDWVKQLNDALSYIESALDGQVDAAQAARYACCSTYHFQRMFSHIAGVPLSEYIRRRRMTQAAVLLQKGAKVADVAQQYGYESPTAFNRAFQGVHGISPSAARKPGAHLKAYPRISFQMTIKGESEMEYRIEDREAFRIVGWSEPLSADMEESFARVPAFWQEVAQSGRLTQLVTLLGDAPQGILGLSTCSPDAADNRYFIAVSCREGGMEGMDEFVVPASKWAIFSGSGTMPDSVQKLQKRIVAEWLPASGYEWAQAPDIELYLNADPTDARFEVWLPIIAASQKK